MGIKVAVFDIHKFEKPLFEELNTAFQHDLRYLELHLNKDTAHLAKGTDAVCVFAHDKVGSDVLHILKEQGVRLVALRSAGFNHVDIAAATRLGIKVVRVPAYSPYAIAEHAVALILALDRKLCRASARVRELNFSLDGLVGFDLHGKNIGIIGTGRIGVAFAKIMHGFGCRILAYDIATNEALVKELGVRYVTLDELYRFSDIISLHVPLTPKTHHLIDESAIVRMPRGVMLINTGRGGLVDAKALINGLKSGHVGAAGLDVYEEEENVFLQDLSQGVLQDDVLARLMTFPNVLITAHQAFLTREALHNIVETTLKNIQDFEKAAPLVNEVKI